MDWEQTKLYNSLKYLEVTQQIEIVALTAKNIPNYKKLDNYKIINRNMINNENFDYILVMSLKYFIEIRSELIGVGIMEDRIISCNILHIPNLCLDKYFAFKKRNISIISNDCWGGIVYNTLGLKCTSPFKNLFLKDEHYLKLLSNLRYYLNIEPEFIRSEKEVHSGMIYPVLGLDDIEVYCNHDTSVDDAINKWNRRKKYLNYNDLFIEMYTVNEENARKFSDLDMYKNKVCFAPFRQQSDYEMTLRPFPEHKEFWEIVNSSAGRMTYLYDLVDLLSGVRTYRVSV